MVESCGSEFLSFDHIRSQTFIHGSKGKRTAEGPTWTLRRDQD
jgi:hypothetical protein